MVFEVLFGCSGAPLVVVERLCLSVPVQVCRGLSKAEPRPIALAVGVKRQSVSAGGGEPKAEDKPSRWG